MTNLNKVLKERFGFNAFKPGQAAILEALIAGQNVVGILPTGGGKSLIYQMMGSLRPGVVLIVSPLLSLMQDQVGRLNFLGEAKAIALNSTLDQQTRTDVLRHLGDFHYIFVSPEMLTNPSIQRALRQVQINLMVVDEAHTIVSWGPDFRPEYLQLAAIHAQLNRPQLLLLTATATQKMLASMLTVMQLDVQHTKIVRLSVNRENIYLQTTTLDNEGQKREEVRRLVQQLRGPGVIYFASRKLATSMASWLNDHTDLRVAAYHAGLDAVARFTIQQQFMQDELDVITATSAFGMGIDKNDIRYVIHYHLSRSMADYVQEFGRAGRDGQSSIAIQLYVSGDERLQLDMIRSTIPSEQTVTQVYDKQIDETLLDATQLELIHYYQSQNISASAASAIFARRLRERLNELQHLLHYVTLTSGLRDELLTTFDEPVIGDVHHEGQGVLTVADIQNLGLMRQPITVTDTSDARSSWQQKIDKLFNIK